MEQHKHCVFCGEAVSFNVPLNPKGDFDKMVCHSPNNTLTPDTCGRRYHGLLDSGHVAIGRRD
jgi:hypothetical protein